MRFSRKERKGRKEKEQSMRIETERMKEREATEELIRRLVWDNALRGEFMILSDEADDENFVQVACDYDDAGGGEQRRQHRPSPQMAP